MWTIIALAALIAVAIIACVKYGGALLLGLCRMAGEADDAADAIQDDMQQRGLWS